jgi:hypothetical protein
MNILYQLSPFLLGLLVVSCTVVLAIGGFFAAQHFVLRRFKYHARYQDHDAVNEAITGALGAIGVFYGITVGLIAIDVWQRHSGAVEIAAKEAAAIQTLFLMTRSNFEESGPESIGQSSLPQTALQGGDRTVAAPLVSDYLSKVICFAWPRYRDGQSTGDNRKALNRDQIAPKGLGPDGQYFDEDWLALKRVRDGLERIEPSKEGAKIRYAAAIQVLNELSELRRRRDDAADDRLSGAMWAIVICGALLSMSVVYLFRIEDKWLHMVIVGSLSGLLGLVLMVIVVNDRPFLGKSGIEPDSYTALNWMIPGHPFTPERDWREACESIKRTASR